MLTHFLLEYPNSSPLLSLFGFAVVKFTLDIGMFLSPLVTLTLQQLDFSSKFMPRFFELKL